MALSKDRLRRIHGIPEPTGPVDPAVFERRNLHRAATKWLVKWSLPLHATLSLMGFFVVLLPMLSMKWRAIVENAPLARTIFHDYSTFSGLAMLNLFTLMSLFLIRSWVGQSLPGGATSILSYKNLEDMELYPRSRKEELAYWVDISFGIAGATLWLFLPFGALAYFIRMG